MKKSESALVATSLLVAANSLAADDQGSAQPWTR